MNQEIYTLELAKLYESQGYHKDAHAIYKALEKENPGPQIRAGISRTESRITAGRDLDRENKIAGLFEKWFKLIILQYRLGKFEKIKSRLI